MEKRKASFPDARLWEKTRRFEARLMAYKTMETDGKVPVTGEIINFHSSRFGEPVSQVERARMIQARYDLYADLIKNLDGMANGAGITFKQYIATLKKRGLTDLIEAWNEAKTLWTEAQK